MHTVTNNGNKPVHLPGCILQPGSSHNCILDEKSVKNLKSIEWLEVKLKRKHKKKKTSEA